MKRKRVNTSKESLVERLVGEYDVPPELMCGGCFAEIRGRHHVTVRGCKRVVKYSPEAVMLKMRRDTIVIEGKRLRCLTYFSGAVSVEGIIDSICFVKEQERMTDEA